MTEWCRRLATSRPRQGLALPPSCTTLSRVVMWAPFERSQGQEPGGLTLRQLGIGGTNLPAGPCPNSHSRFPVILRIDERGQVMGEDGHGLSVPTQVLSPLSNTPAWLLGSV